MKATGFIKEIDDLGRIVIPKSVRKAIGVNAGDSLQLFLHKISLLKGKRVA